MRENNNKSLKQNVLQIFNNTYVYNYNKSIHYNSRVFLNLYMYLIGKMVY